MNCSFQKAFCFLMAVLLLSAPLWSRLVAADTPGMTSYVEGLDALERAKWNDAIDAFTKSIDAEEENPDYYVARGVALALGEQIEKAQKDLERANRLRPNHTPTKLWLATTVGMQGRFMEDSNYFPAATRDPYETAVREMSHKYGEMSFRLKTNRDEAREYGARWQKERDAAKEKFPMLAKQFVERAKPAGAPVAGVLKTRGIARYQKKQYAEAFDDLEHARQSDPSDVETIFYIAGCKQALGSPEGARADYTLVLTQKEAWGNAYIGRAFAHAALGSVERAREDFSIGAKLKPETAAGLKAEFEKRLAELAPPPDAARRAQMLTELMEAAKAGAKPEELAQRAVTLVKAVHATRLRSDERHQYHLRDLREAVRVAPNNPDAVADLSEFLYDAATTVITEWVEPRAEPHPYRPQTEETRAQELAEAENAADAALRLNSGQVKALAFKAACLIERFQWGDAETNLRHALELKPYDPIVLDMFSRVMDHAGSVAASNAAGLRSVEHWSDFHYDYYRYPSQAELREANELDAEAHRLWDIARKALLAAAEAERGKPLGYYYLAIVAQREGDIAAARTELETAVKLQPDFLHAWRKLSQVYSNLKMTNESFEAQMSASNVAHTTAAPMLKLVWLHFNRTAWKSSGAALDRAALADPADARVAAYRGSIAREKGNAAEAAAWFFAASAINDANAILNGVRLHQSGAPLSADDAGLAVQLNLSAGELMLESNQLQAAADQLSVNLPLYDRIEEAARYAPLPHAMIPRSLKDPTEIPQAPNIETMLAWTRLRLGQAFYKLNRLDDAAREFQWVISFEGRKPHVIDVGSEIRTPANLAAVWMFKTAMAKKDFQAAKQWELRAGYPKDLPEAEAAELEQLRKQLMDSRRAEQEAILNPKTGVMTANDYQRQRLTQYRATMVQQKTAAEKSINDPNTADNIKRSMQSSLKYFDGQIANTDRQLKALDQNGPNAPNRNQAAIDRLQQQIQLLQQRLDDPRNTDRSRDNLQKQIDGLKQQIEQLKK